MQVDEIDKSEKSNLKCGINVFGIDKKVYPLRISNKLGNITIINLLLISNALEFPRSPWFSSG